MIPLSDKGDGVMENTLCKRHSDGSDVVVTAWATTRISPKRVAALDAGNAAWRDDRKTVRNLVSEVAKAAKAAWKNGEELLEY